MATWCNAAFPVDQMPMHTASASQSLSSTTCACCPPCTDWLSLALCLVLLLYRPLGARRAWRTGMCLQPCTLSTAWLLVNVQ
jgi:hypothetical protein